MRAFHLPVLCRFARVDEVVDYAVLGTEPVEGVQGLHGSVASSVDARVVIGERGVIIGLNYLYGV